jgi:hypothetical protein
MKKPAKIIFVIAVVLWTIGAVLLYKKESPNTAIIITGVILIVGFFTQILKKYKKV